MAPKYTLHNVDPDIWSRADEKAKAAGWNMGDLLKQFLADFADGKVAQSAGPPRPRPHGEAPRRGSMQTLRPGRIVFYRLTPNDVSVIMSRRQPPADHVHAARQSQTEVQGRMGPNIGNPVSPGDIVPMMVVAISDGLRNTRNEPIRRVNGQAFLDGTDTLWVTDANQGTDLGEWYFPQD